MNENFTQPTTIPAAAEDPAEKVNWYDLVSDAAAPAPKPAPEEKTNWYDLVPDVAAPVQKTISEQQAEANENDIAQRIKTFRDEGATDQSKLAKTGRYMAGLLPGISTALDMADAKDVREALEIYQRAPHKLSEEQKSLLARTVGSQLIESDAAADDTWLVSRGKEILQVLKELPPFAVDIAVTRGVGTGAKVSLKTAMNALWKQGLSAKTAGRLARVGGGIAEGVAGGAAAAVLQTPGFVGRRQEQAIADSLAQSGGDINAALQNVDLSEATLPKAYMDAFIESASEYSGGLFVMSKAAKTALAKRLLSEGLRTKLANAGLTGWAATLADRVKWNGLLGEMMEERVADVGHMAMGDDGGMVQDLLHGDVKAVVNQVFTEGVAFSIPGAGFAVLNKMGKPAAGGQAIPEPAAEVPSPEPTAPTEPPEVQAGRWAMEHPGETPSRTQWMGWFGEDVDVGNTDYRRERATQYANQLQQQPPTAPQTPAVEPAVEPVQTPEEAANEAWKRGQTPPEAYQGTPEAAIGEWEDFPTPEATPGQVAPEATPGALEPTPVATTPITPQQPAPRVNEKGVFWRVAPTKLGEKIAAVFDVRREAGEQDIQQVDAPADEWATTAEEFSKRVAKKGKVGTKVPVVWYQSSAKASWGMHEGGVIYMNSSMTGEDNFWSHLAHEVTHVAKLDEQLELTEAVQQQMEERYLQILGGEAADLLRQDPAKLRKEGRALFVGEVFRNPQLRAQIQQEQPTLWQQIVDAVRTLLAKYNLADSKDPNIQRVVEMFRGTVPEKQVTAAKPAGEVAAAPAEAPVVEEPGLTTQLSEIEGDKAFAETLAKQEAEEVVEEPKFQPNGEPATVKDAIQWIRIRQLMPPGKARDHAQVAEWIGANWPSLKTPDLAEKVRVEMGGTSEVDIAQPKNPDTLSGTALEQEYQAWFPRRKPKGRSESKMREEIKAAIKEYGYEAPPVPVVTPAQPKRQRKPKPAPAPQVTAAQPKPQVETAEGGESFKLTPAQPAPGVSEAERVELKNAGLTLKRSNKGWVVTGIPEELADGLTTDYKGRKAAGGRYFFQENPVQGLLDAAREVTEKARRDAAAEAQGLVVTRIGDLTPEQADWYEQARQERLASKVEGASNRGVDALLANFMDSRRRGEFKMELRRASDPDSITRFDEMVEYAKDHPELGLPSDETELFDLLRTQSFNVETEALLAEVDNELATELERMIDSEGESWRYDEEAGDISFDVEKLESGQTAIPGFAAEAASAERSDQAKASRGKFESKKGKQKTFLTDLKGTKYAPGTQNLFETEGLPQEEDEGTPPPAVDLMPQASEDDIAAFKSLWKNVGQASMEDVVRAGEVLDSLKGPALKALAVELGQPAAAKFGVGELRKFLQNSLRERVGDRRRFEARGPDIQLMPQEQGLDALVRSHRYDEALRLIDEHSTDSMAKFTAWIQDEMGFPVYGKKAERIQQAKNFVKRLSVTKLQADIIRDIGKEETPPPDIQLMPQSAAERQPQMERVIRAELENHPDIATFDQLLQSLVGTYPQHEERLRKFADELKQAWERIRPPAAEPVSPRAPVVTALNNAMVDILRAMRGLAGFSAPEAESFEQWLETASGRMAADPQWVPNLVTQLSIKSRGVDNIEAAAISLHYRYIWNRYAAARQKVVDAYESGDTVAHAGAMAERGALEVELNRIEEVSHTAGTEAGRALVARKIALYPDNSEASLALQMRAKKGGEPLNEKERAAIQEYVNWLKKNNDDLRKQLDQQDEGNSRKAAGEAAVKIEKEEKAKKPTKKQAATERVQKAIAALKAIKVGPQVQLMAQPGEGAAPKVSAEMLSAATEVVRAYADLGTNTFTEFLDKLRADSDADTVRNFRPALEQAWKAEVAAERITKPTIKNDESNWLLYAAEIGRLADKIARAAYRNGAKTTEELVQAVHNELVQILPDFTLRDSRDALSRYGQFREASKEDIDVAIAHAKQESQKISTKEDYESGQPGKKTGQGRVEPSAEYRRLTAEVNELKKKWMAEQRAKGVKLPEDEKLLRTAEQAAIRALEHRLEDMRAELESGTRIIPERLQRERSDREKELRAEIEKLRPDYEKKFPKKKPTREQRVAAIIKALDRSIEQLRADLAAGKIGPAQPGEKLTDSQIMVKQAELDSLRKQRDAMREADPAYQAELEAKWQTQYSAKLTQDIAELERMKATGQFAKKPRKVHQTNRAIDTLLDERKRRQMQIRRMMEEAERANWAPPKKIWEGFLESLRSSRALLTSGDLSFAMKQGGIVSLSHPILAASEMPNAIRALSNIAAAGQVYALQNDPWYQRLLSMGLGITTHEESLARQEEFFMGRWFHHALSAFKGSKNPMKIGARAVSQFVISSENAYVTWLNNTRLRLSKILINFVSGPEGITDAELKIIVNFVNVVTGRGMLPGRLGASAQGFATAFFAPRYLLSRVQYLMGQPIWTTAVPYKGTMKARLIVATEYARFLAALGLFYGLVGIARAFWDDDDEEKPTITLDPRSADFGKLQIGNTRVDPLAGLAQVITVSSRLISGETVNRAGYEIPIRGEDRPPRGTSAGDVAGRFFRSKTSPWLGTTLNLAFGENMMGEPTTVAGEAVRMVVPMSFMDIINTAQENGMPKTVAVSLASILGAGVLNYEKGQVGAFGAEMTGLKLGHDMAKKAGQPYPREAEVLRGNRYADTLSKLRKVVKDRETAGEDTTDADVAMIDISRMGLRRNPLTNPLAATGMAPDVQKAVDDSIATAAYTVARSAKLRGKTPEETEATIREITAARDFLHESGADLKRIDALLTQKLIGQKHKADSIMQWRRRFRARW